MSRLRRWWGTMPHNRLEWLLFAARRELAAAIIEHITGQDCAAGVDHKAGRYPGECGACEQACADIDAIAGHAAGYAPPPLPGPPPAPEPGTDDTMILGGFRGNQTGPPRT